MKPDPDEGIHAWCCKHGQEHNARDVIRSRGGTTTAALLNVVINPPYHILALSCGLIQALSEKLLVALDSSYFIFL